MKTRAQQIRALDAALRATGALTDVELKRYLKLAGRAGGPECSSQLDSRASLWIALHAPRGRRGPAARDPVVAAIYRGSPTRQRDLQERVLRAGDSVDPPTSWVRIHHTAGDEDREGKADWTPLIDAAWGQP